MLPGPISPTLSTRFSEFLKEKNPGNHTVFKSLSPQSCVHEKMVPPPSFAHERPTLPPTHRPQVLYPGPEEDSVFARLRRTPFRGRKEFPFGKPPEENQKPFNLIKILWIVGGVLISLIFVTQIVDYILSLYYMPYREETKQRPKKEVVHAIPTQELVSELGAPLAAKELERRLQFLEHIALKEEEELE